MATATTTDCCIEDSLHPPAIVHIPEENSADDPTSPCIIDSPLSSPRNFPHAWEDDGDFGVEEEEECTSYNTSSKPNSLPLGLPELDHMAAGCEHDGSPFDEGRVISSNNSKSAALHAIRDERMQRKMRRRQHVLSEQNVIEQQRLNQSQNTQNDPHQEEQPFDHQDYEATIEHEKNKHEIVEGPGSPEEQPFDAPQHRAPAKQPGSHPRENDQQQVEGPFDALNAIGGLAYDDEYLQHEISHSLDKQQRQAHSMQAFASHHLDDDLLPLPTSASSDFAPSPVHYLDRPRSESGATLGLSPEFTSSLVRRIRHDWQMGNRPTDATIPTDSRSPPAVAPPPMIHRTTGEQKEVPRVARSVSPRGGRSLHEQQASSFGDRIVSEVRDRAHSAASAQELPFEDELGGLVGRARHRRGATFGPTSKAHEAGKVDNVPDDELAFSHKGRTSLLDRFEDPAVTEQVSRQTARSESSSSDPHSSGPHVWVQRKTHLESPLKTNDLTSSQTAQSYRQSLTRRERGLHPTENSTASTQGSRLNPLLTLAAGQQSNLPPPESHRPVTYSMEDMSPPAISVYRSYTRARSDGDLSHTPLMSQMPSSSHLTRSLKKVRSSREEKKSDELPMDELPHIQSGQSFRVEELEESQCPRTNNQANMSRIRLPSQHHRVNTDGSIERILEHVPVSCETASPVAQHNSVSSTATESNFHRHGSVSPNIANSSYRRHDSISPSRIDSNNRSHNIISPNLAKDSYRGGASPSWSIMDDDASWLAQRLHAREQQHQAEEGNSRLGERIGSPDRNFTARGKSDAPGTSPGKQDSFSSSNANQYAESVRVSGTRSTSISDQPTRGGESKSEWAASYSHRTSHSVDSNLSAPFSGSHQPARRTNSDVVPRLHATKPPRQNFNGQSNLADSRVAAPDRVGHDETNSSQAPGDVGSLIESLDGMVKDLEGHFTPEKGWNSHIQGGKSSMANLEDAHSSTQATSTLSSSFYSEKQMGVDPTPKRAFKGRPVLVQPINNDFGIPKGDIMVSLLSEQMEVSWSARIEEAIWRCRTMRQNCDTKWLRQKQERRPNSPSNGRTPVLVDGDDVRVVAGIESVAAAQKLALEHLKHDELEDALALYEDIVEAYYTHFENCLRENTTVEQLDDQVALFSSYIASCLHNIGLVYLLLKKPKEAYSHFERAVTKRAATFGVGHTDHLVSSFTVLPQLYESKHSLAS